MVKNAANEKTKIKVISTPRAKLDASLNMIPEFKFSPVQIIWKRCQDDRDIKKNNPYRQYSQYGVFKLQMHEISHNDPPFYGRNKQSQSHCQSAQVETDRQDWNHGKKEQND